MDDPDEAAMWRRNLVRLMYEHQVEEAAILLETAIRHQWIDKDTALIYREIITRMRDWRKARTTEILPSTAPGS